MAYQYGYINIKNLDNTSKISNFALMKNFAAIDFETANLQRTSVCSVGIVIVGMVRLWIATTVSSSQSLSIIPIGIQGYMD